MTSLFKDVELQVIIGNQKKSLYIKLYIYIADMKQVIFVLFLALLMSAQINKCDMYIFLLSLMVSMNVLPFIVAAWYVNFLLIMIFLPILKPLKVFVP